MDMGFPCRTMLEIYLLVTTRSIIRCCSGRASSVTLQLHRTGPGLFEEKRASEGRADTASCEPLERWWTPSPRFGGPRGPFLHLPFHQRLGQCGCVLV